MNTNENCHRVVYKLNFSISFNGMLCVSSVNLYGWQKPSPILYLNKCGNKATTTSIATVSMNPATLMMSKLYDAVLLRCSFMLVRLFFAVHYYHYGSSASHLWMLLLSCYCLFFSRPCSLLLLFVFPVPHPHSCGMVLAVFFLVILTQNQNATINKCWN